MTDREAIVAAVLARRYSGPPNAPPKRFHALYVGVMVILVLGSGYRW